MKTIEGILDSRHPQVLAALGEYKDRVDIACVTDGRRSDEIILGLEQAAPAFPDGVMGRIRERQVMRYLASTITPKEKNTNGTGIFLLPGSFGTAPGELDTVAALYNEASKRFNEPIKLGVSLSSSFSQDTLDHPLLSTLAERATNQAVFMLKFLREYQLSRIWLMGHSSGGLETMYAFPVLKKLIKEDNLNTRVEGLILIQSSGLYKQNPLAFIKRHLIQPWMDETARYMYPDELTTSTMAELKKKVMSILVGADLRGGEVPFKSKLKVALTLSEELNPVPDTIRNLVDVPVGMMWGENDNYFPATQAQDAIEKYVQQRKNKLLAQGITGEQADRMASLFPNSPMVKTVVESNWPHAALAVNTKHFSRMALDLMQDIKVL